MNGIKILCSGDRNAWKRATGDLMKKKLEQKE